MRIFTFLENIKLISKQLNVPKIIKLNHMTSSEH